MNNYERIKNMSVEEMAELIMDTIICDKCPMSSLRAKIDCRVTGCFEAIEYYLQQEVSDE